MTSTPRTPIETAQSPTPPVLAAVVPAPTRAAVATPLPNAAATPAPARDDRAFDSLGDPIPEASMGRTITTSALASMPGYAPPVDPEAGSVRAGHRKVGPSTVQFTTGESSPEALAAAILEALATSDRQTLNALRISSQEFAELCWPEFPESRPVTNIAAADAWDILERRNLAGVTRAIDDFGGQVLTLDRLVYKTGRTSYTNFTLYQDVEIIAHDETGAEQHLTFARTFVERKGRFKVYTYKD